MYFIFAKARRRSMSEELTATAVAVAVAAGFVVTGTLVGSNRYGGGAGCCLAGGSMLTSCDVLKFRIDVLKFRIDVLALFLLND